MFELTVRDHIMIAHSLDDEFFGPARALHGATLVAEVTWQRDQLDAHGVVLDIGDASSHLEAVLSDLNYRNLDEHPAFEGRLSTTEVIAQHIALALVERMDLADFVGIRVTLREHPDAWATYHHRLT